ncbi:MAG: TIGR00159 family protein [Gemmatimonadetes bacterium]|nr:TIGR00159 family protein [Gemmatimonadota bacterium]
MDILDRLGFLKPGLTDLIQILIVTYALYRVLLLLRSTRALQVLLGLFLVAIVYGVARLLDFTLITTLLSAIFTYGVFAAIVVFQPELRNALARLGQSRVWRFLGRLERNEVAEEIAAAAERLSRQKIGAIIAIERELGLEEYVDTGTRIEAKVSAELLATLFTPYSPLHDGAVIVRRGMIVAAGCILPLTQFPVADKTLGTRHRAAIGLSEETDAFVVVVSEETGAISVAERGRLERNVTPERLGEMLIGARSEDRSEAAPLAAGGAAGAAGGADAAGAAVR